jgi:hypothetical protein
MRGKSSIEARASIRAIPLDLAFFMRLSIAAANACATVSP